MGGFERQGAGSLVQDVGSAGGPTSSVGKRTLTESLGASPVQMVARGDSAGSVGGDGVQEVAARGVAGAGGALPHGETIQRLFGRHDVSGVQAHVGGDAATASREIGAEAYATGNHVAFAGAPSLHTAAHEAAHVVQQRSGVHLKGGVGAAGDAYEQHADQVADAVVRGESAEALLDQHSVGGGGTVGVQRQAVPGPASSPTAPGPASPLTGPAATSAPAVDPKVIIQRLDTLVPSAFDVTKPAFDLDRLTAWMELVATALEEAKSAAGSAASPEMARAIDGCVNRNAAHLQQAAEAIRTATVQLANDSSVTLKTPSTTALPTLAQVSKLGGDAGKLNQLTREPTLAMGDAAKASLLAASTAGHDAGLALLQALSVGAARDRWKKGSETESPSVDKAGKGARNEVDEIYKDSGHGSRASVDEAKGRIFDWCGYFVASSHVKGASLARQLRAGFDHTDNVEDFFKYEQLHNDTRAPMAIWAEGQWWDLKAYHKARGSMRQWTTRAAIKAALAAGGAGDIRPGDTCLINHTGGDKAQHIVMVESYNATTKQLVSIEGNTYGIHADSAGAIERVDDDHLKAEKRSGPTAAGIHVRELWQLAPGPGKYVVTDAAAYVRDPADITKFKMANGKKVVIPVDTAVDVTEVKESGGKKLANVDGWGWTSVGNLGVSAKPPEGGYTPTAGATVLAVGRPSMVDFEDGHEYAVRAVPAELKTTSPDEIRKLAKEKGKAGAAAQRVTLK